MNYSDTIDWMFAQLPMYQRKGKAAFRADLSNIIALSSHLGNPEKRFRSVHVAGTNGKGSTSHMIASILQEAGYNVGLYTSPHLKDFRERIRINGKMVSKKFVIEFIESNRSFFETRKLSFFEMTVGMAFDYFAKKGVDIAIIETGLGGRLDSTNIIVPEVSVITNISYDHTQFLGTTLESIAGEKAGIIKPKVPLVVGQTQDETKSIFSSIANENRSEILFADQWVKNNYESDLKGPYQKHNIKTAVAVIMLLTKKRFNITKKHIISGLLHVVKNTGIKGRWQILGEQPMIICDTAHNKEGLSLVLTQLNNLEFKKLHFVLGFVNDKDLNALVDLFPKDAKYYFCRPDVPRGLDVKVLTFAFKKQGFKGSAYSSVKEAFKVAKNTAEINDLIYVGGSTFVVAEVV